MEVNASEEIRRRQKPVAFKGEIAWFAKGFYQPQTKRAIAASTIDAFQTMIWDKPEDDLLPTYGESYNFSLSITLLTAYMVILRRTFFMPFLKTPPHRSITNETTYYL